MQNSVIIIEHTNFLKKPRVDFTSTIREEYNNGNILVVKASNHSGCSIPDDNAVKSTIEIYFKQKKSMQENSLYYTNDRGTKMYVTEIVINSGAELIENARKNLNVIL